MKIIRFLFISFIVFALFVSLNYKWGDVPPLGKFLDPFNGFWQNAENEKVTFNSDIFSKEIEDEIHVKFDERLVPHIFAKDNSDLFFAQGFVTAQHRLWQMEIQTRVAAGRLSEIVGDGLLKFDREQRRQGMVWGAENALKAVLEDSISRDILTAYTKGINHYINSLNYKSFPVEYKLLDYSPEHWTPLKTCLLLKYMAKDLGGYDQDFELTNALKRFGKETFNLLFGDNYSAAPEPIIPEGTSWNFKPLPIPPAPSSVSSEESLNAPLSQPEPDNGSNNWAVSGKKTVTGKPILANDPHLGLNLPSLWYEIQLHSTDMNVYGASLPGAPGVIIGFNDSISWGVTNVGRYVKDWYKIDFKDNSKNEYLVEKSWLKTSKTIEEIKIKGKASYFDTIIYTSYGPVVYDQNFYQKNQPFGYALRWIAHDPSLEILTFHYLNKANNYNDYVNALKYFSSPAQNFVFASSSGDIAMWIAGKFPLKWQDQGKFLMDGSREINNWKTFIPFEHSPNVLNPPRNFVSSTNQQSVAPDYPYPTFEGDYEYYRNRRLNNVLEEKNSLTVKDMMDLQNDNFNLMASESLPVLLANLKADSLNSSEQYYYNILKNWDFYNEKSSLAAPIFQALWDTLYNKIYDEMTSDSIKLPYPENYTTINLLKNNPTHFIFNIVETPATETAIDLIKTSFSESVRKLEKLKRKYRVNEIQWAQYKGTRIKHLFKTLEPFHTDTLTVGGHKSALNAMSSNHGPSWRMIVQLGNKIEAYGVYPGGQSGNPGSPYYNNFIKTWENGKYYKISFLNSAKDESAKIIFTQTFKH